MLMCKYANWHISTFVHYLVPPLKKSLNQNPECLIVRSCVLKSTCIKPNRALYPSDHSKLSISVQDALLIIDAIDGDFIAEGRSVFSHDNFLYTFV